MATLTATAPIQMRDLFLGTTQNARIAHPVLAATEMRVSLSNGVDVRYTGTGFTYNGNDPTGGTVTMIELLNTATNTVFATFTGLPTTLMVDVLSITDPGDVTAVRQEDTLNGSEGDDRLFSSRRADVLNGNGGDDQLAGGGGPDIYNGGTGFDYVRHRDRDGELTTGLTINLADPSQNTFQAAGDVYNDMEGIISTDFDDILTGNAVDNDLQSNGGNDILNGLAGDDRLQSGAGIDQMFGGTGNDMLYFDPQDAVIDGGADIDTAIATTNDGLTIRLDAWNVEQLIAGGGSDFIFTYGTAIYGVDAGAGNDTVAGNVMGDFLSGNVGDDVLFGYAGNDTLGGGGGSDRLMGMEGADTLFGEADPDSFVYRGMIDAGDTIFDFETAAQFGANADKIEIWRDGFLDPALWNAGALDPSRFVAGQATLSTGQFLFDTATGRLFWDNDGTGAGVAQLLLTVQGVSNLSASDFVLV